MRKVFKYLGIGIATLVIIIGSALLYIYLTPIPSYAVQKIDYHVTSTPESIERGKKLSTTLCGSCHLNEKTGRLSGKKMTDSPPEFGEVYSQNITQDKTHGIGNWTDGEILYLLRTGIKKNGQYAPPYMSKLPHMADEDINAIISFLRSDNPIVAADPTPSIPCKPTLLSKILCRIAFKPFPMPTQIIAMPDTNNTIELGNYLATNLDCFSCHSADFKTNNYLDPKLSEGYLGGGNKLLDKEGRVKLTPNLTPDKETGIGNWSKVEFINALKSGIVKGQPALQYPMLPYAQLSDAEAGAIFDYLQSIPPISNKVEKIIYD